jgi:alpha-tubulin suppressor-like RCC1 family protein
MGTRIIPVNFVTSILLLVILSCDSFKEDFIEPRNQVTFSQTEYYILPSSSIIIDQKSLIKESFSNVSLNVSQNPMRGELSSLDTFLLKYKPAPDFTEGKDQFVFSVLSDGKVLKTETMTIFLKQHQDEFPCAIYTVEDRVKVKRGSSISIRVLENDRVCGTNSSGPKISIYSNPRFGEGSLEGDSLIVYTPGPSFKGLDEMVYRLTTSSGSEKYYGVITIDEALSIAVDTFMTIAAGASNSLALKADGTLWLWGGDYYKSYTKPQQIGAGFAAVAGGVVALKQDSTLWAVIYEYGIPKLVKMGSGYSAIAGGGDHSLALKTDGTLWAWGHNNYGQLGNGSNVDMAYDAGGISTLVQVGSGYTAIAAGDGQSFALKADHSLWAWGGNDGVTQTTPLKIGSDFVRIAAGGYHLLAQQSDGTLWEFRYYYGQRVDSPAKVRIGKDYVAFAAGGVHSLALKADGTLWAWGGNLYVSGNEYGQLGDGTNVEKATPVQIGSGYDAVAAGGAHSLALKADGTLWAWGNNGNGQLGDGTTVHRYSPVRVVY